MHSFNGRKRALRRILENFGFPLTPHCLQNEVREDRVVQRVARSTRSSVALTRALLVALAEENNDHIHHALRPGAVSPPNRRAIRDAFVASASSPDRSMEEKLDVGTWIAPSPTGPLLPDQQLSWRWYVVAAAFDSYQIQERLFNKAFQDRAEDKPAFYDALLSADPS